MQTAILPSPGRSDLKGILELPSRRLKGEDKSFIYAPRTSTLVCVIRASWLSMLLAPANVNPTDSTRRCGPAVCQNPTMPPFALRSRLTLPPPSHHLHWSGAYWESLTSESARGESASIGPDPEQWPRTRGDLQKVVEKGIRVSLFCCKNIWNPCSFFKITYFLQTFWRPPHMSAKLMNRQISAYWVNTGPCPTDRGSWQGTDSILVEW